MKKIVLNYWVIAALAIPAAFTSCNKDGNDKGGESNTVSGAHSGNYASWSDVSVSFDEGDTLVATAAYRFLLTNCPAAYILL